LNFGTALGGGAVSAPGQPGAGGGEPGASGPGQLGTGGQPGASALDQLGAGAPGRSGLTSANLGAQVAARSDAGGPSRPGLGTPSGSRGSATALSSLVPGGQVARIQSQQRAGFAGASGTSTAVDLYRGSGGSASASLLSQSGIGAYIHLLSALASNESDQKSAALLTNNLGNASATLRATYSAAIATLPAQLQQKDWSFSVNGGVLVFTAGKDSLSPQDISELQKAFANANVTAPAREVAAAIATIQTQKQSGADAGTLAWGGLGSDETQSGHTVNLRSYVTTTVPGSTYQPAVPDPASHPEIPALLGGMDLRELVSARPNFLRPDGSVSTAAEEEHAGADEADKEIGTVRGQCSCGEIQLLIENDFEYAFYCHCSRCRARTGSAFAAIAGIGTDKVQVIAGSDHLLIEGECADGYGARCSRCYAFLFAAVRERKYVHVSLGVLSESPRRLPDHHIYVGSKAPWYEITDGLPQYTELPEPKSR